MALSGRELTLVLRARDEASRTIGRLSSGMSKLDRDATRISNQQVRDSHRNLQRLRRDVHDIEEAYQRQTLAAREAYFASKKDATAQRAYQRAMLDAQQNRVQMISDNRILRQQQEDFIDAQKEHLRLLSEERDRQRYLGQTMMAQGTAAMATGAALTYMGVRGVEAFTSNIQVAKDYQTQVARTATQVDKAGTSMKQISDIGKEVAKTVPVAFEEIQPALYDIFSSIDTSTKGAEEILKQFAKDAVGGQVDIATATKANLAIMNAYNLKAKDSADVSDFMFRLVQKGVGTYEDFAKVIGRVIPSAARAGQTYQTAGAMLAFMTRNGLSAAMASSSAARALDAISNPKTVAKLEEMGVTVKDMRGEFLPLPDILDQMAQKFGNLTKPELASKLQELFKSSGGTIQARRFFDMYFKNAKEFNQRTKEMGDTAGQAEKAFNQMADSPQAKLQELKNNWMLLRIEIGENLLPIALKLVDWANSLIDAFNGLDPGTRKAIELTAAFSTVLLTLLGVLTVVGGAVWAFNGAMTALGFSAGKATGKIAAFSAGLVLMADGFRRMSSAESDSERDLAGFEQIAGGALLGFAVGGPIGLALGAGAGAIAAIGSEMKNTQGKVESAIGTWQAYADTLNDATAATTEQTKAMVYDNLVKANAFKTMEPLGVSYRTITNAIAGQTGAQKTMNKVLGEAQTEIERLQAKSDSYYGQPMIQAYYQQKIGLIREAVAAYKNEGGAIQEAISNEQKRIAVLKGIPKEVVTHFTQVGLPKNMKDLKALQKEYDLKPKQVRTVFQMAKLDASKKDLDKFVKSLKDTKKSADDVSKQKVKVHWTDDLLRGIKQGVQNSVSQLKDLKAKLRDSTKGAKPNLSSFHSGIKQGTAQAAGEASTGGHSVGTALKSGVMGGLAGLMSSLSGAVAAAVHAAIAAGRAAAKAHSPSLEMMELGQDMVDGLLIPFEKTKNKDHASKASAKLVKHIMAEIQKNILHDIGTEGYKVSIGKFLDIAREQIDKKLDDIAKHLKGKAKKAFEKSRGKKVKSYLADVADDIKHNVNRLEHLNARLKKVRKDLADAQNALDDIKGKKTSFAGAITDYGSFGSFGLEVVTVDTISATMSRRLQDIQAFGDNLNQLKVMGFSQQVIDMILAMPIQDAMAYAAALVKATPGQVGSINQMNTQLAGVGGLADQISSAMYDAGITAAQSLVDGLKSKEEDLEEIARRLGHKIAKAIKDELKMKSPSKVALAIAHNFGNSLGKGLSSHEGDLDNISRRLAVAMQPSPSSTYTARPANRSSDSAPAGNQTIQKIGPFYTTDPNPRAWASKVGWHLATRTGL